MDNSTIEFERKAYREILVWKQNLAGKTALLVEGARRVSKTHLVKRFAQQEYESFIYIDFSAKGKQIRAYRRAFAVTHHTCTEIMEHVQLVVGHEVDLTQHGLLAKKVPRFVYHEATPPEFGRVLNPDGRNLIVALTFLYVGELRVRDICLSDQLLNGADGVGTHLHHRNSMPLFIGGDIKPVPFVRDGCISLKLHVGRYV